MVASRPQPPRGAGITTVHIWLIVFVGLWLVSTVLAVLLYTRQEELDSSARAAQEEAQRYMHKNEASRFSPFLNQVDERQSLAAVIDNERIAALRLIGVDDTTSAAAAARLVNETVSSLSQGAPPGAELPDLAGADLITIVRKLAGAWQTQAQAVDDARKRLADATRKLKGTTDRQIAEKKGFADALAKLSDQLAKIEQDTAKLLDDKNAQIKDFGQQLVRARDELERPLAKQLEDLKEARAQIDQFRDKLRQAREQLSQFRPQVASLNLAEQADGNVIRANPGEENVYINLGKANHLTLGLRFQVYSASAERDPSQGKATIEVVGIHPTTSECRVIVSSPANPIIAGDHVVNVVYDRDRKYRFVVEGQFDIDGDGRSDPQDIDRIKAWVASWGGEVVELPQVLPKSPAGTVEVGLETVDFVILGAPPPGPPMAKKGAPPSPEERVRSQTMQRVRDRFFAIEQEAKDLSLAVLTQSQFLHFIGYGVQDTAKPSNTAQNRTAMDK